MVATARTPADAPPLRERELVALWLLGRVPEGVLPWPLLRPGRAGRGPGPDVREAAFGGPAGVVLCGDVEVHLAASDFVHHGHLDDPAYADVVLHLVWRDDRPERGTPQPLPGGGSAPTVEVGPALGHDPSRLRRLVRRGPSGAEPCAAAALARGPAATSELVRAEGRRRLAERTWRAADLAAAHGWDRAWDALLDGALLGSAGRRRETLAQRAALAARLTAPLAPDVLRALRVLALDGGARPRVLIGAFHSEGAVGPGRAAEVGWNAALPLLAAAAAAYDDAPLARATADLAERWPAPRPYGRTRALASLLGPPPRGSGAQHAQGLLHLQDLWCSRGGCGQCPLSSHE
ncbi:MAG: DUF2851 family protein [Chloroflexi bacterium]|nr:DUF2851 family protein [Chloroflexota bacterium]